MKTIPIGALVLLIVTFIPTANAQDKASFKSTQINPNLIFLQGKGGNIALSKGSDGILIIDDDYPEMSNALKKEIEKFGGIDKLKFILNTHWHGDHTGNNANLGKGVNIIAHDNVRKRLKTRTEKATSKKMPDHALPNLTYPQSMVIHFNDDTLTLQHYPKGHTDGDTIIFFEKANTVHMGDQMFHERFPYVDTASGGDVMSYTKNVQQVINKINDDTVVIPGHGPLTDKKGLIGFHKMLIDTIAEVRTMKSSGLSLEKIRSKGLSKKWESWGQGFINESTWISTIYKSL